MKKQWKRMLSLLFVLTLMFNVLAAGAAVQAAETGTLAVNENKRVSWPATVDEMMLDVTVTQTGFYTLTVRDHMQAGELSGFLEDATSWSTAYSFYEEIGSTTYESDIFYLVAGHEYILWLGYYDEDWNTMSADISVMLQQSSVTVPTVPSVDIGSSNLYLSMDIEETTYLRFTSAAAGDYTVCFSQPIGAYISVYDTKTGEQTAIVDTQYQSSSGDWFDNDKASMQLRANTDYVLELRNYNCSINTYMSITKNAVNVIGVDAVVPSWSYYPWETVYTTDFDYWVYFSDGSHRLMDGEEMAVAGLPMPSTWYLGAQQYANETLYGAGLQPVEVNFGDAYDIVYVTVEAMTDWLISSGANPVGEYDNCLLENDLSYEYGLDYWLMNVEKTGAYAFYSADWDNMEYANFEVIDEQNRVVQYNDKLGGYPLVGGRNYVISLDSLFANDEDLTFYSQMETSKLFPDVGKGWYTDAVAYAVGSGIMTGYKNGNFGTTNGIQRQDFLVMLARLEGVDLDNYPAAHGLFPDVAKGSYYEAAVTWGYENGIVTGYNSGNFGVGDLITREQLVTFLYRYAAYRNFDVSYDVTTQDTIKRTYSDAKRVSVYAKDPVAWAVENGVIKGKTATKLAPQGNAQRCEVAQMMYNIFQNDVL